MGILDINFIEDVLKFELIRCIGLLLFGLYCFLFVLDSVRFMDVEKKFVEYFVENYGNKFYDYLVVVFIRKDDFDCENMIIEIYLDEVKELLKEIFKKCNYCYIVFNNMDDSLSGER